MAMIKCPECGAEISDKAKKCIHCGKVLIKEKASAKVCSECGKEVPMDTTECPYCGCPIDEPTPGETSISTNQTVNEQSKKKKTKIIIPIVVVIVIVAIVSVVYNVKVIKPKNTYNEAVALLEKGKYDEANELFNKIKGYSDVETIQEQLKYESYAYSAINSLKQYLKNPDSYQPYEITFYASMGTGESSSENETAEEKYQYPICIMHYGAQNGFGGNTTSYAMFGYNSDEGEYTFVGSCKSLNEDDYDATDVDDTYDLIICKLINIYRDGDDTVGSIDLNRLKTVLKNDAYSTIKIIE
jgi:hypothetical protein